jgi:hypothetical protein
MQFNLVVLYDWTRCKMRNLKKNLPPLPGTEDALSLIATPKTLTYQVLVMERAEGDVRSLARRILPTMTVDQQTVWAREFLVQIYATLAQLHARYAFKHNDLQFRNVRAVARTQRRYVSPHSCVSYRSSLVLLRQHTRGGQSSTSCPMACG